MPRTADDDEDADFAARSAVPILDALTTPIRECGGVVPVEVNDRQLAEDMLAAALRYLLKLDRQNRRRRRGR